MKKLSIPIFVLLTLFISCDYQYEEKGKTPDEVILKSISVTKQPEKNIYYEGETFSPKGMEVTAIFSDGSKKVVSDYEYSPKTPLEITIRNISVSYTYKDITKNTSVAITVQQSVLLESIYIATMPSKLEYVEGELFDKTGLKIFARYIDGTEKEVVDYTYSPEIELTTTDTKIIISYTEGAVTVIKEIAITVSAAPVILDSIKISKLPVKLNYWEGDKFDPAGMEVTAVYSDGSERVGVKGFIYSPKEELTSDINQVEVSYTQGGITKTAFIDISVKEKPAETWDYDAVRSTYGSFEISGGDFEKNGNVITLTPDISLEKIEYKISGYFNGQIINNTKNTILSLNNAFLENTDGKPVILSTKKIELSAKKDTVNYILSSSASSDKIGAIHCYNAEEDKTKDIELGGAGTAYIIGNCYHGVKADEVKTKGSGKYYIKATEKGSAINCNTFLIEEEKTVTLYLAQAKNGIKADENISISSGSLYFDSVVTALKTDTKADDKLDKPKDHFINLSNCDIFTKNIGVLYSTEENSYSEFNVAKEEF